MLRKLLQWLGLEPGLTEHEVRALAAEEARRVIDRVIAEAGDVLEGKRP